MLHPAASQRKCNSECSIGGSGGVQAGKQQRESIDTFGFILYNKSINRMECSTAMENRRKPCDMR